MVSADLDGYVFIYLFLSLLLRLRVGSRDWNSLRCRQNLILKVLVPPYLRWSTVSIWTPSDSSTACRHGTLDSAVPARLRGAGSDGFCVTAELCRGSAERSEPMDISVTTPSSKSIMTSLDCQSRRDTSLVTDQNPCCWRTS